MKVIKILFFCLFLSVGCFGQGKWTRLADFPGMGKKNSLSFVIEEIAYVGLGEEFLGNMKSFWSYNPVSDTWTQVSDFQGAGRGASVAFIINQKAYVGTGFNFDLPGIAYADFWEYDATLNNWTQKADFPEGPSWNGIGFSIGNKGYVGLGSSNSCVCNFIWEYDPLLDVWKKKNDFPGSGRLEAISFTIGDKAFVGFGKAPDGIGFITLKDLWEYNAVADSWTQKTGNELIINANPVATSDKKRGYVFSGNTIFIYDKEDDKWITGSALSEEYDGSSLFFTNNYVYLVSGFSNNNYSQNIWQFNPSFIPSLNSLTATTISTSRINLSWNDETTDEEKYEIYRSTTSGSGFIKIAEVAKDTTNYADTGLVADVTYYYKIKAVNVTEGIESDFSNEANATTSLSANISLQAYSYSQSEIRLAWSTDNTSVGGYKIERSDDESKGYSEVAEVPVGSAAGYIDNNLTLGKTYFYRIRAFKGNSFSQYSNRIGANTKPTSINETLTKKIKVLSNPNSTGIFQIKTTRLNTQDWQLELRDGKMKVLPQNLIQKTNLGYQIDLSQYPAGMYFLMVDTKQGKAIKKLLKQ